MKVYRHLFQHINPNVEAESIQDSEGTYVFLTIGTGYNSVEKSLTEEELKALIVTLQDVCANCFDSIAEY